MSGPSSPPDLPAAPARRAYGVYIGRFEPLHNAHLAVMLEALTRVERLILVIGSARGARSTRNPFTAQERQAMITAALTEAGADPERLRFTYVRDYFYNESLWLSDVQAGVAAHTQGASDVALIGHVKDDSSYYLRSFPAWAFLPTDVVSPLSATDVRRAYFGTDDARESAALLADLVPPSVERFLAGFRATPEYAELREEERYLQWYRASWAGSPYPPVFVTTDGVITRSGHVLLVRRGGQPGHGRLALPGGYLDTGKRLLASCVEKVQAETGLATGLADGLASGPEVGQHGGPPLSTFLRAQAVFDYPERDLRGRTIAHAFHFDLGIGALPPLTPGEGSGAAGAMWVPLSEALAQPEAFFEDHYPVMEHFLLRG